MIKTLEGDDRPAAQQQLNAVKHAKNILTRVRAGEKVFKEPGHRIYEDQEEG